MMRDDLASLVDDLRRHDGPWPEPAARARVFLEEHGPGPTDWPTWETGAELYAALTPERVSTLDRETTLLLLSGLAREAPDGRLGGDVRVRPGHLALRTVAGTEPLGDPELDGHRLTQFQELGFHGHVQGTGRALTVGGHHARLVHSPVVLPAVDRPDRPERAAQCADHHLRFPTCDAHRLR